MMLPSLSSTFRENDMCDKLTSKNLIRKDNSVKISRWFRELESESRDRFVRIFFASHTCGGIWPYATDTSHPHSRPARHDGERKNRPPVGLEVRKATRDILCGLDSTNIYAYSARGNEYLDIILFTFTMRYCTAFVVLLIVPHNYILYDHFVYDSVN